LEKGKSHLGAAILFTRLARTVVMSQSIVIICYTFVDDFRRSLLSAVSIIGLLPNLNKRRKTQVIYRSCIMQFDMREALKMYPNGILRGYVSLVHLLLLA
jgi:hypothetical protein